MNNKLSTKILDAGQVSKLISEFNIADYVVRDSSEIKTVISILLKEQERLKEELAEKGRESGYDAIVSQIDSVTAILKSLLPILSSRVEDASVEDKSLVSLTKDDVVEVVDNGESRYETTEVIDSSFMFYTDVSYSIPCVEEYNDLSGNNKTEEAFFYDVLCKFVELSIDNTISYAKKYLSELDSAVVSEIIEKNYEWHTLLNNFSINKAKLNAALRDNSEKRNELLNLFYIKKENNVKTKNPNDRQLNLFTDFDYEEVNVLLEGDTADEPREESNED